MNLNARSASINLRELLCGSSRNDAWLTTARYCPGVARKGGQGTVMRSSPVHNRTMRSISKAPLLSRNIHTHVVCQCIRAFEWTPHLNALSIHGETRSDGLQARTPRRTIGFCLCFSAFLSTLIFVNKSTFERRTIGFYFQLFDVSRFRLFANL